MHFFVAIELPKEIIQECERIQKSLQEKNIFTGKAISSDQMHITLKFLTVTNDDQIPLIVEALSTITFESLEITVSDLGVFEEEEEAVIFLRMENPFIDVLVDQIESALEPWCKYENRAFIGHITLFHVKQILAKEDLFLKALREFDENKLSFIAHEFVLQKSDYQKNELQYTILARYPLTK